MQAPLLVLYLLLCRPLKISGLPQTSNSPTTVEGRTSSSLVTLYASTTAVAKHTSTTSVFHQPSTSTSVVTTATPLSTTRVLAGTLRGVNIGHWLVLERWMDDTDLFTGAFANAQDQWTFDQIQGSKVALTKHWQTWFTEADVERLAKWGINALRIPIGYWAYRRKPKDPYHDGADYWMELAISWAAKRNMRVLIDLHGVPGSQNGFDNSGHEGEMLWQHGQNQQLTTQILLDMTKKYSAAKYAGTVMGIEMVNEPASWGNNSMTVMQSWTKSTYKQMQSVNRNPNLAIIMHDAFLTPYYWQDLAANLNGGQSKSSSKFWIDTHLYQNQVSADSSLTQAQHIEKACAWSTKDLLPSSAALPVIVGEFSAQTNICAFRNGSTIAGYACNSPGCQCSATTAISQWNQPLKDKTRRFLESEMNTFEAHTEGFFLWSYKAPGAWGLANLFDYGILGQTITQRKYPNLCT